MYPLKYKISAGLFLIITSVLLSYVIISGISRFEAAHLFINKIIHCAVIISCLAIITAPIIFGEYSHWFLFAASCIILFVISLKTGDYAYNMQSLVLFGVCMSVHIFYKKEISILEKKDSAAEKIKEATNIVKAQRIKVEEFNAALSNRLDRYRSLRNMGESFSGSLSLEEIYQLAVDTAYDMIPHSDSALLFRVDEVKQRLELFASKAKSYLPRIKAKHGDIFDNWVFKERQPLSVSDIYEDFRFDYKPLDKERYFTSLISVPLISQSRIIGILRLNSREKNTYAFDDLRLLDFVSDMVASAINNARLYKTTEELATKDSLTGFYIHRYLEQRLGEEIERAGINNSNLSLIMIDIDHFKDYNDKYGHSAGDKVLLEISDIIRKNTYHGCTIARYGGEEIVIVLPNIDKEKARQIAEKIKGDVFSHRFILRRKETAATVSAGVASYSGQIKDKEELLKKVDFCLYKAKREGRNKVCVE